MSADAAHAFESPAQCMRRQFGPTSTAMGGGGGALGSEQGMKPTTIKDGEPTGAGDLAGQVAPHTVTTATSSAQHGEVRQGESSAPTGSTAGGMINKVSSVLHSAKTHAAGMLGVVGHGGSASVSGNGCPFMTSMFGQRLADPTHSLKIAGHPLVSDVVTMEKIQTFVRAKTLERAVHACGSGALGYFRLTHDMSRYTKACIFSGAPGKTTPVAARFSTTTYEKSFPDEARNPRGLAFKFYTADGNYDVLSINYPAFFVRDAALGPDSVRAQQRNPANFQVSFDSMFDFMSLVPESMLANLWQWSDHGTPNGWRFMDGYPCHTFKWVNQAGDGFWIKMKFVAKAGIKNLTQAEAQRISGVDPDYSKRDLWQHIQAGGTAEWTLNVQIMPQGEEVNCAVDIFDNTKVWPESQYPWQPVGDIVMNKNVENYHRDTEQIAFSPGRLIPGIEPSPDVLLQWRLWFYLDAQIHRLGTNYHQIPVNSPFMVDQYHPAASRDGAMRVDSNGAHEPHYMPNSFPRPTSASAAGAQLYAPGTYGPVPDPAVHWKVEPVPPKALVMRSRNSAHEGDPMGDYVQAADFYLNGLDDTGRTNMHTNIAYSLRTVSRKEVVIRFLLACHRTTPKLAEAVYQALVTECERAETKPQVTWDEITQCANALAGKPLVDVLKGYEPAPLPIKA